MKRIALGMCACAVLALGASAIAGGGGKPAANPQVTMVFAGQGGDGVLGDPLGAYTGGVGGVVAELQVNGNTPAWSGFANLLVNLTTTGGKTKRYFTLSYSPIVTSCAAGSGPSASGSKAQTWLNVHSIGAIGIGEVRAVRAYLGSPDGEFGWTGEASQKCSTVLAAYRTGWGSWVISTDVTRLGLPGCDVTGIEPGTCTVDAQGRVASAAIMSYLGTDGKADANGNVGPSYRSPDGVNQLGFTTGFLGNYDMPFAITFNSTDARLKTNYVSCGGPLAGGAGGCSFPY